MEAKIKILFSVSAISTAVFIAGIRSQKLYLIVTGAILLLFLSVLYNSNLSLGGLTIGLIILYPAPQFGYLYGRDSHKAAFGALDVLQNGWPTNGFAFTQTPLLHIHAVSTSVILDLPIYPSATPKWLITSYLPIFYLVATVSIIILTIRNFKNNEIDLSVYTYLIPVIFWIPFIEFHSGFRRESMALVFFVAITYLLYKKKYTPQIIIIFIIFLVALVSSHHLSIALSVVFIFITLLSYDRGTIRRDAILLFLNASIFTLLWYVIGGMGGNTIIGVIVSTLQFPFESGDPNLARSIEPGFVYTYQSFLSRWLYQAALAVPILLGIFASKSDSQAFYFKQSIVFGAIISFASLGAFFLDLPIDYNRLMTFFVISCSWIGPAGIYLFSQERLPISPEILIRIFTIIIIVIGASMVPLHIVSAQPPNYTEGELTQRFEQFSYPAADFAGEYMDKEVYLSTLNLWDPISVKTGEPVQSNPSLVVNGTIPSDTALVFLDWNRYLYTSKIGNVNPDMRKIHNNNKMYTNGEVQILVSS